MRYFTVAKFLQGDSKYSDSNIKRSFEGVQESEGTSANLK